MSTPSQGPDNNSPTTGEGYPTQQHAGKVGYGPNFNTRATIVDKVAGLTQEARGKLMHKPDLVSAGHDRMTGDSKRRKALGLDV